MNTATLYRRALLLSTSCLLLLAAVVVRQGRQLSESLRREQQARWEIQASRDENTEMNVAYYRAAFRAEKAEQERDTFRKQEETLETRVTEIKQERRPGNKRLNFAHSTSSNLRREPFSPNTGKE